MSNLTKDQNISKLCAEGNHEWCANRSPTESHCQCNCHPTSNPVLVKWPKHRQPCPPQCETCELRAEIERLTRELADADSRGERKARAAARQVAELNAIETTDMQKELGKLRSQVDRLDGLWNLVTENRNGAYDKTAALLYVKQYSPLEPRETSACPHCGLRDVDRVGYKP